MSTPARGCAAKALHRHRRNRAAVPRSEPRPPMIDRTSTVDHGPRRSARSLLPQGRQARQARGITLSFGTFEELVATNTANTSTWHPLIPLFDPKNGPLRATRRPSASSAATAGRGGGDAGRPSLRAGRTPASSRRPRACASSMPIRRRSKQPKESCVSRRRRPSSCPATWCFSGGGWYRRDYRKRIAVGHPAAHLARARLHALGFRLHDQHHGREGDQGRHGRALRLHQRRLGPACCPTRRPASALRLRMDGAPTSCSGPTYTLVRYDDFDAAG